MGSTDQIDVIFGQELFDNGFPENEANPSIIVLPIACISVGVGPENVAKKARVWHISRTHYIIDCQDAIKTWGESTVHAQNFLIDQGCDRQTIEAVCESFPEVKQKFFESLTAVEVFLDISGRFLEFNDNLGKCSDIFQEVLLK